LPLLRPEDAGPPVAHSGGSAALDPPYRATTQGRVEQAQRFHQCFLVTPLCGDMPPVPLLRPEDAGPSVAHNGGSAMLDPPYRAITQRRVEQAQRFHQWILVIRSAVTCLLCRSCGPKTLGLR